MKNFGPLLKTVLFTIFVPATVAGYVPWRFRGPAKVVVGGFEEAAAITTIVAGVLIYLHTAFWGFAWTGGGTPAPIAPTKRLVVVGLHRYVRNPMYIGVGLVIAGQAWLFWSTSIAVYALCVMAAFHIWVLIYEEPTLHRQFGGEYDQYRARVPRWVPEDQTVEELDWRRYANPESRLRHCGAAHNSAFFPRDPPFRDPQHHMECRDVGATGSRCGCVDLLVYRRLPACEVGALSAGKQFVRTQESRGRDLSPSIRRALSATVKSLPFPVR